MGDTLGFCRSKVVSGQNCLGKVGISQVMSAARDVFTRSFPKGAKMREYMGSAEWGSSPRGETILFQHSWNQYSHCSFHLPCQHTKVQKMSSIGQRDLTVSPLRLTCPKTIAVSCSDGALPTTKPSGDSCWSWINVMKGPLAAACKIPGPPICLTNRDIRPP